MKRVIRISKEAIRRAADVAWNRRVAPAGGDAVAELIAAADVLKRLDMALAAVKSKDSAPAGSGEVMDAIESLAWAEEYFEQRADAEFSPDVATPHGNEEMVLLVKIQEVAALLRKLQQGDRP